MTLASRMRARMNSNEQAHARIPTPTPAPTPVHVPAPAPYSVWCPPTVLPPVNRTVPTPAPVQAAPVPAVVQAPAVQVPPTPVRRTRTVQYSNTRSAAGTREHALRELERQRTAHAVQHAVGEAQAAALREVDPLPLLTPEHLYAITETLIRGILEDPAQRACMRNMILQADTGII